jgi:hypothetical protein
MRTRIFFALVLTMIAAAASEAQQRKDITVRIPLDASGVSDFTFLNRAKVANVDSKAVEFFNSTPDRTFIVTMPFTYTGEEFQRSFAMARERRGGATLSEIVCGALPRRGSTPPECMRGEQGYVGDALDRVEELRVLLEALGRVKGETKIEAPNKDEQKKDEQKKDEQKKDEQKKDEQKKDEQKKDEQKKDEQKKDEQKFDLMSCAVTDARCLIQRTFAVAAVCECNSSCASPKGFVTTLSDAADRQVNFLMTSGTLLPAESDLNDQDANGVVPDEGGLGVTPRCATAERASPGQGALDIIGKQEESVAVAKELSERRFAMAKAAFMAAVSKEATQTLNTFDVLRQRLQQAFTEAQAKGKRGSTAAIRQAEIDRALYIARVAKLLGSYSPESPVPFPIRPAARVVTAERTQRVLAAEGLYAGKKDAAALADAAGGGDYGMDIGDCKGDDKVTCVASAVILPRQYARFSNDTLRHNGKPIITFSVEFFGQSSPPANGNAYVTLTKESADAIDSIPSTFGIKLGLGGATGFDVSNDFLGHYRHTSGTGSTAIEFTGGIVDASVGLRFKNGDFGGPADTNAVSVAQYQAKISGPKNLILQFGRLDFAKPSAGIALSEKGEGVRLAYKQLVLSHVIHREGDSLDQKINRQDDDSYVGILELKNWVPQGLPLLSGVDFSFAYGNNKDDETPKKTELNPDPKRNVPYTFVTFGSEARFTFARFGDVNASLAAYHSQRSVRPTGSSYYTPDGVFLGSPLKDGRGTVALMTFGWSFTRSASLFEKDPKNKPTYGPTFTIGRGTSDKSDTPDRDEGYLGENAGFSQDKIFLSAISVSDTFKGKVGEGLKGKWYGGVQWNDNRWSLLLPVARAFGDDRTIVSYATIAAVHSYWFADKQQDASRSGGVEADLEFQLESPAKVTWTLGGAFYHRSQAVKLAGLIRDPWQITAGVSLSLKGP